jgi:predicted DNA-binding transcriptional regulator YafY
VPSSYQWLTTLVGALRDRKCVQLTYQSFWRDEPTTFVAHPYCLKLFKQRWYLLARSDGKKTPFLYGLDRILNVEVLSKKAKVPASFNAEEFFADHYGIIVGTDNPLCTVELRVVANQVKYFDSLPLHWTQKKVEETPEYTIYSYHLIPSFDFRQEILGRGAAVKVLTPDWFKDEIAEEVKKMVNNYD